MNICPRLLLAVGIAIMAVPTAAESLDASGSAPAPTTGRESGWQFSVSPYLWMSGLKGDMGVIEEVAPVGVDMSFFDILDAMKFSLMGGFEARNGRFVGTTDMVYLKMGASENIEIREADFLDVELGTTTFIATATAGYRAVDRDGLFVDVFAGGRYYAMKTSLDLDGPQRSFSGSKTETWIDPIIGASFQAPIAPNWSVRTYGDIGGFGISSHLTWQLRGEVQYDLSRHWSLTAGWRHLDIDYDHKGFVFDAAMDGPILGATYRF